MITLFTEEFNLISQDFYNDLISDLQFHRLTCPCGKSGCLTIHGYYDRRIKTSEGKVNLHICRVLCSSCGHTHALLPSSIVPYSQVSLADQTTIIKAYESQQPTAHVLQDLDSVDIDSVRYIVRQYRRHWKQRLQSERIKLRPLEALVTSCFRSYMRQFMQIHCTPNRIFLSPT